VSVSLVCFYEEILFWAKELDVFPKRVSLRPLNTKWGYCTSSGSVVFDRSLLKEPEYRRVRVIIHELLHLRYPNHDQMFNVMEKAYYDKFKKMAPR